MKRILLIMSVFITIQINVLCQVSYEITSSPTTEIEYNYVVKGIASSIEQGLDLKKGYTINGRNDFDALDANTVINSRYGFNFAKLIRQDSSYAAMIVKVFDKDTKLYHWFCIPHKNNMLVDKFLEQIKSMYTKTFYQEFLSYYILYFQNDIIKSYELEGLKK